MPKVSIQRSQMIVGNRQIPLVSGEMHYWRLNPSCWESCLRRIKEMGITVVSTYVPWGYHEYKRGAFDFSGKTDPARGLVRFLKLAKKEGMWVIIRPGPYIYSEWPNDGVPNYAYKYHRLHPQFLRYAGEYIKKVCRILRPYLATKAGGHILLLQADNEIDPWPDLYGNQYGFGKTPGLFQDFIRHKYRDDLVELNEAWGTAYSRFEDAGPYEVCEVKGEKALKRNADYFEFKHDYSLRVARWVIATYKKYGITVPLYLNAYPFFYAHDWQQLSTVADLVGIDLYPENEFAIAHDDHRKMMDKVRYLKTFSSLPYIAEFASGIWHNHHYATGVITPNHYRLLTLSMIQAGVRGWNWYMLVGRDNWYMSPINEWGRTHNELFAVFKSLVTIFRQMKPYACKKQLEVAVAFSSLHYATQSVRHDEDVLQRLYEADIDYEFFDMRTGRIAKKIVFYAGSPWLSAQEEKTLETFVRNGGVLVAFRSYPQRQKKSAGASSFCFQDPDKILFKFKKEVTVRLNATERFCVNSTVCAYNRVAGTPIKGTVAGSGTLTIGYERRVGKGKIIHIGLEPNGELLRALLRYCGVTMPTQSLSEGVTSGFFTRAGKSYVVAVNNSNESKTAVIRLAVRPFRGRRFFIKNMLTGKKTRCEGQQEPVVIAHIPRKDGVLLEVTRT